MRISNRRLGRGGRTALDAVRRAANLVDLAAVTCRRIAVYTTLDRPDRAVEIGLEYLRHTGVTWSPHPTDKEAEQEYERIWHQLGSRPIEALLDLPQMSDPAWCATIEVLAEIIPPALFTDNNLHCLVDRSHGESQPRVRQQ